MYIYVCIYLNTCTSFKRKSENVIGFLRKLSSNRNWQYSYKMGLLEKKTKKISEV